MDIYQKKKFYHRNFYFKESKSNGIIYPNFKSKYTTESLKFLNEPKLIHKYILSKVKKKMKETTNSGADIYKISAKNINLSLPKKLSKFNLLNKKITNLTKPQNKINYNNNNYFFTDKYNSETLINTNEKNNINYLPHSSNENVISKETNFFIDNNKTKEKMKIEKEKEKMDSLNLLWDYLCVPKEYRELFNVILHQLEEDEKNILIKNECNELNELKTDIENLLNSIKMRKDILNDLKGMNNGLKLIFKKESEESNSLLVKRMSNKIEKMRNYTITICFDMKKIKNKIYEGYQIGKYNLNEISKKYEFDINYLIKMKEEMNFLKDGNAKYFFNIIEDRTPFLVKASEEDPLTNGDPFIHLVPLSSETKKQIEKCNYIIYQELIGYQNKDFIDNKFRPISPLRHYNRFEKPEIKLNTSCYKNNNNKCPLLRPIKSWFKQAIFDNDINNRIQDINNQNMNSILKENSCINFEIKNNEMQNLLKKKLMTKYLTICNNINTTLGGNNIN